MNCEKCNLPLVRDRGAGESTTLVGYCSPDGHDHDDNCVVRHYRCANEHDFRVSVLYLDSWRSQ